MPGEDIQSWSPTATDNGNADTLINWVEGQTRASVNNSARSMMAAHAKHRNLLNGSIVTTGTANAQAFLSGLNYTTIPTGLVVKLKIGSGLTNDASATLNMDGIGATLIQTVTGENLLGMELVGDCYTDFIYNGTNWVFLYSYEFFWDRITGGGGVIIGTQVFSASGIYTPDPTTQCVIVECVGGGGGGGGATCGAFATTFQGGGGGAGEYARKLVDASDFGAAIEITIGDGGLGGHPGLGAGSDGGNTSFGTLCIANGGVGGGYASPSNWPFGGAGGSGGVGDFTCPGNAGGWGMVNNEGASTIHVVSLSGDGGAGPFGGGKGTLLSSAGQTATGAGAGGSGGNAYNDLSTIINGGDGADGVVIITEFAGRGAPGRDGAQGPMGPIGPPGPAGAGTGDVLVSGTPAAGQWAQWTDTSHIKGIAAPPLPTTGDIKPTFKIVADAGWIILDDGSIGSGSSGATTRADADTLDLFMLFWNNIPALIVQDNTGATVTRGANASTDFIANRRIVLPKALGHALGVAGAGSGLTARALGATVGTETVTQTYGTMWTHNHSFAAASFTSVTAGSGSGGAVDVSGLYLPAVAMDTQGGGSAANNMPPTTFVNVMVKL